MKILKISLIHILSFSLAFSGLFYSKKAEAVDLGPFSVTVGFCAQIQKVGAILNSFTIVQWPVGGFPGITMGMLQNTSVIMDFCNYITQLEQLDTNQAIFFSANYLNTLTGKKWDDHLQQADRTWNLANSVYDFENGETRKGAFESESTYRELNEYMKDTKQWSSKTFNGRDADVRTRGQRENDMQRFAGAAYRRAIIKEMTSCPEPEDNKNYGNIYSTKIRPQEVIRDEAQEDYMFFKDKLFAMGPKFLDSESELEKYINEVEQMETAGIGYEIKELKIKETTTKNSKTKTGSDKKPVKEKKELTRVAQQFTTKINEASFNNFKSKYSDRWKSWIQAQVLAAGSYGFLDNPEKRVEDEFRDLNYECNERRLMQGFDSNKPNYDFELDKRKEQCLANVTMDQKKSENLLNYYATQLQNALYKFKNANASIWTTESKELGRTRVITKNNTGGFQQEEVSCAQSLTPAEMDKLALKQQSVNNELNEIIAKETMKSNMRDEEEAKQKAEANKESSIRKTMIDKKSSEQRNQDKMNTGVVPGRTGIGGGK